MAGGFGLCTRRLDLHGSTQPASCHLLLPAELIQPAPPLLFPDLGSPASGSCLFHFVANLSGFSPSLSNGFPLSRVPATPSYLLSHNSFYIQMCNVSEPASKRTCEQSRQSASCAFPMAAAPASKCKRFGPGVLPLRQQQGYPGNRLLFLHNPLSGLRGEGCWGAVQEEITAIMSHSQARCSSGGFKQGCGWGFLLFYSALSPFSLSPRCLSYTHLIPFVSHLISPCFICLRLPPLLFLSCSLCFYLRLSTHPRSNSTYTHPNHLSLSPKWIYQRELGRMSSKNNWCSAGREDLSSIPQHLKNTKP